MAGLGEQPDFAVVQATFETFGRQFQAGLETIGRQFGLGANLPGVVAAGAIVEQLGQMQRTLERIEGRITGIDGRITGIEGRITGIEGQVTELNTRAIASNENTVARSLNSHMSSNQALHPLRNPITNEEIPGFPERLDDIDRMTGQVIAPILVALGLPIGGSTADKRKRLKVATGFVAYSL
ncbi:hypothetical protein RB595_000574 [Gaeumannomyces hyphopodioides]